MRALERVGYTVIPWEGSLFAGAPCSWWKQKNGTMADESDDDLYGDETATQQTNEAKKEEDNSSGDEPMDEESGDEEDSDSVCRTRTSQRACASSNEAVGHRDHH